MMPPRPRPAFSKYLLPKEPIPERPVNLDLEALSQTIAVKRAAYYSDPNILRPLEFTTDEVKALRYWCETSPFYPLDHIGYPEYALSHDSRLLTKASGYITRGYLNKEGRSTFTLTQNRQQRQIQANVLMAMAFLGPQPSPLHDTVDHMDIDSTNDYVYNLRWATRAQQNLNRKRSLKPKRGKPVTQINPVTGEEIFTWFRAKDACMAYGLTGRHAIGFAISNNYLSCGFAWRYAHDLLVENGIMEEWRRIDNETYSINVSSFGRVYTTYAGMWYGRTCPNGRKIVGFKSKDGKILGDFVHRLIALAFLGPPPNPEMNGIDHKDGNPKNNRVSNLEYVTSGENNRRCIEAGTRNQTKHEKLRKPIVQLTAAGDFIEEYASTGDAFEKTGFKRAHIHRVLKGERKIGMGYQWVYSKDYFPPN